MPKLIRNTAVLAKIQPVAGTDAVPTAAANAMQVSNLTVTPIEQETESRALYRPYLGNSEQMPVSNSAKMEFEVELAGSGTAGLVPAWGPLLRACGFAEADGASDVIYTPRSTGFEMVSIYAVVDQLLHKLVDGQGDVTFMLDARKLPKMKFTFTGLWSPVTDVAAPTPDYTSFRKAIAINKANTPTFTLHGFAGSVESLTLAMKNQVNYRNRIGRESVDIGDRLPDGSLSMEMVSVGTKDWLATIQAGTTGALHLVHGATAGNIIDIAAPAAQLFRPRYADDRGMLMLQADLALMPNAGNDEIVITVK